MEKKYRLAEETINVNGRVLHRIEALRDFGDVCAGDKGGFVESEDNLAYGGSAWVSGNASVYDNARVSGDARVCGNAWVSGNARVSGDAWVSGNAWVSGDASVCGDARVSGDARVCGNAWVYDKDSILWITHIGSRLGTTTAYRNKDGGVSVVCGCFEGTLEEFEKRVDKTHGDNKYGCEYKALIELIKIHFEVV